MDRSLRGSDSDEAISIGSCAQRSSEFASSLSLPRKGTGEATGFRSCKRCNPDGPSIEAENAILVAKACRIIEESEEEPSLEVLAAAVGRSPSYFHRTFKAATVPKDYAAARRAAKVRQGLASSGRRFYEKSTDMLGMTPSQYRAGWAKEQIRFAVGQTSMGAILVASSTKGVAAIH